jgi:mono/diheme cytochrome c family protein
MHTNGQVPVLDGRCHAHFPRAFGRFPLGCALLLALASMASGAEPVAPKAKSVQELKGFYEQNCTRCHGRDGSARASDGKNLGGLDFTKAATDFRTLSGPASEREIRTMSRTVRKGIFFGYTMPGWKDQLSQEDATLMVREILLKAVTGKVITPESESVASK